MIGKNIMFKPVAESCIQNQQVILDVLKIFFTEPGEVLEIGSGTGQHGVFFTQHMQHLLWQPSDLLDQHAGMQLWLDEVEHDRIKSPLELNVDDEVWLVNEVDYVFTANTTHIISSAQTERLFQHIGACLKPGGLFAQYGPFNYNGQYTSESNARFDVWLQQRDPNSCIKHFETVQKLAEKNGLFLVEDVVMPANNRILMWRKAAKTQ